ncbi:lytic transglycosylase domain-containing protein, partial [candidate division KSB1 bacterium]|nr:lytic transglycosylase domain-containing protein [candidate division KSB1 bacterium]NIR71603.1 lytic transglycosylase domain-containing protein [candidate division KSB1 bacterium]NIS23438.1 lytic transglycosylase domain-containing protein [candidate division KSB1 bacterium]NIT70346.1 lytic transglycosylase domain-containing protein [candidate division KSB1 bacterium]NIU24048.1 lytic transglycosylase domain-containing protein [candidate division KSB1 bacterium]
MPMELLVLPHVESSFNHKAYSKFGAAGIWQFTRSTGRRYLKINYEVDERLDPIRAT